MWYNIGVTRDRNAHFHFRWMSVALCVKISTSVPVAQLDRAFACGAKGRWFESSRAYHIGKIGLFGAFFVGSISVKRADFRDVNFFICVHDKTVWKEQKFTLFNLIGLETEKLTP